MAKTQGKKSASKPTPEKVTYTHRSINRQSWERFRARAKDEGHTAVWLLDQFIEKYGNGDKVF
ncbi:MAG: hypothetical protein EBY09_07775 [Verrucomicrobia bacterium]|nr:hypothetical protein [Verrucomicrobiota bacterium]NBU11281.1 hypothetical protein [Pseudomonadota bacterium]NDA66522.1 hypothetical protein [Verrucomicrobiota bacterium]NDD37437.1 hypothetical protein [Verrucomicrobiota bacterium]NDE97057.1 hypothetical protein [Verrucomicrobiota bacterium]